jgi:hypothetical protein
MIGLSGYQEPLSTAVPKILGGGENAPHRSLSETTKIAQPVSEQLVFLIALSVSSISQAFAHLTAHILGLLYASTF